MTWDYTQSAYKKQAKKDPVWHLERQICYGFSGEKIDAALLKKYFKKLKIPEDRKAFLSLLLWKKF